MTNRGITITRRSSPLVQLMQPAQPMPKRPAQPAQKQLQIEKPSYNRLQPDGEAMRYRTRKESPFGILLVDVKDAALMCGIGVSTVWKLVKHDEHFPKPVYFNARCARFKVDDLRKWAEGLNSKGE